MPVNSAANSSRHSIHIETVSSFWPRPCSRGLIGLFFVFLSWCSHGMKAFHSCFLIKIYYCTKSSLNYAVAGFIFMKLIHIFWLLPCSRGLIGLICFVFLFCHLIFFPFLIRISSFSFSNSKFSVSYFKSLLLTRGHGTKAFCSCFLIIKYI